MKSQPLSKRHAVLICTFSCLLSLSGCSEDEPTKPKPLPPPSPVCVKIDSSRVDTRTPVSEVADWGQPVRLDFPVNTLCPQDAIEISPDGSFLYIQYTEDLLGNMSSEQILARYNNVYRLPKVGAPNEFGEPEFYDLGKGIGQSFNGELSFSPDGSKVYFHSLRATNQGYLQNPPIDDFLDIYVAEIINGVPGPGRNLGPPVNSVYPDGEQALHPDGVTLYFTSRRPGGQGEDDIWRSTLDGSAWSVPVNLGAPINSLADDLQPTFTADWDTMYFSSSRNPLTGMAIYRSARNGADWGTPELVISGLVGEASLTADGQLLYFVHVLEDASGRYDADVWYCERVTK